MKRELRKTRARTGLDLQMHLIPSTSSGTFRITQIPLATLLSINKSMALSAKKPPLKLTNQDILPPFSKIKKQMTI